MSNQKSMAEIHSIEALHASGHSNREIARLLGIDRGTVNKYVARLAKRRQQAAASQNRPEAPTGSEPLDWSNFDPHKSGSASQSEPYRAQIQQKLEQGLSATRIHQDLKAEHGAQVSYYSVLRLVRKLETKVRCRFAVWRPKLARKPKSTLALVLG